MPAPRCVGMSSVRPARLADDGPTKSPDRCHPISYRVRLSNVVVAVVVAVGALTREGLKVLY